MALGEQATSPADSRAFYSNTIESFLTQSDDEVLGRLTRAGSFAVETTQRDAWLEQLAILRRALEGASRRGKLYFEFAVPRLGSRIDTLLIIDHVIFVLEFKVGEKHFTAAACDQVVDYALDLKNFHETSHHATIVPVLIATGAEAPTQTFYRESAFERPLLATAATLPGLISEVLHSPEQERIDCDVWEHGRYCPTPTIIEAAQALWGGHAVEDISRRDADATNLTRTSAAVSQLIENARARSEKAICFVTGVPGAGKTLVGLDIATKHFDPTSALYSVYLSGNGPLVKVLHEALARDQVRREAAKGNKIKKGDALNKVAAFIQNVHHFRDDGLADCQPPVEHVALFDEAQRAWDLEQTAKFMKEKRKRKDFGQSEPEFLISCLDRHPDWAVVVCLVGGGQEINTGEAGIGAWIDAILAKFSTWQIHISPKLHDTEYGAGAVLRRLDGLPNVYPNPDLHLGVSMRSFRSEHVSLLVKQLLDRNKVEAQATYQQVASRFPIALTRSLREAKSWLRAHARGSERYGIVVSSEAKRLKPLAIDVRSPADPVNWFLNGKSDVRSSFYLEDVATEFDVQGLEVDWACVVWDADLRYSPDGWTYHAFRGSSWDRIRQPESQNYLRNAYRVLLTRARQGVVIVVPEGDQDDPTRLPEFYDGTYEYLRSLELEALPAPGDDRRIAAAAANGDLLQPR